jgi:hypothetical protein
MRGGKRPGAGRKKGTVSEATRRRKQIAEEAAASGITPLELQLQLMRHLWSEATDKAGKIVNIGKAMQANVVAKDAAPFVHPRLANVEADVNVSNHEDALDQLE